MHGDEVSSRSQGSGFFRMFGNLLWGVPRIEILLSSENRDRRIK